MTNYRSLNHTKWACQYHVVFIPKYRKKAIYGELRGYLGEVLRRLAQQRESEVEEGHLLVDHVHMLWSSPPKHSVAQVIGYIKGKSAIHIAREFAGRPRNFVGQHFWARGDFVSTVGRDEQAIRTYIQDQELEDRRQDQLRLEERSHLSGGSSGRGAATSKAALSGSQLKPPALPGDTYFKNLRARNAHADVGQWAVPTRAKKKRPRDPNRLGKLIVDIATGEAEDSALPGPQRAGGLRGGPARAAKLTPEERRAIAQKAAAARWATKRSF